MKAPVLAPRHEEYDEERAGSQTVRRHRPDLVVGAAGPADVQAAVTYTGSRGLPVPVQGTGHRRVDHQQSGTVQRGPG